MANKRKNFIREKRIYCGEEYLEVDIVAVTNMPEAGKGKKGKSSQAQKKLNDKRSKRRFVQIANTNFGTNDFHISATYNNEHLPMSLEEAEKNVHNYLDRIKRKMKRETGEDLKYMLVTEYTPEEEEGQLTLQGIDADDKATKAVDPEKWIDPMIMFAEIYGEWNERRGSYKWQSLTKCATYYGYEFKAHDSLEDVKATLYAYKKMREKEILRETSVRG